MPDGFAIDNLTFDGYPEPERGPCYAALGDFYSSGEGTPPFTPRTIANGYRSVNAWPRLLSAKTKRFTLDGFLRVLSGGRSERHV